MLQEMIPADDGKDWIVHGYCNAKSKPKVLFTGMKLRSYAGPTTLRCLVRNDALGQQATEVFSASGYQGIMDCDYGLERRDGRYHLLDFNPRMGAQFRLWEGDNGIDVVRAIHLDLTGRPVPAGHPVEGRTYVGDQHFHRC